MSLMLCARPVIFSMIGQHSNSLIACLPHLPYILSQLQAVCKDYAHYNSVCAQD